MSFEAIYFIIHHLISFFHRHFCLYRCTLGNNFFLRSSFFNLFEARVEFVKNIVSPTDDKLAWISDIEQKIVLFIRHPQSQKGTKGLQAYYLLPRVCQNFPSSSLSFKPHESPKPSSRTGCGGMLSSCVGSNFAACPSPSTSG